MNLKSSERGNTHVIVVGILVVVIIGLLGFVFWKNLVGNSDTKQQPRAQPQVEAKTPIDTRKLTMAEWGLSGSYDESILGILTYTINDKTLTFSSPKVNALLPCTGLNESSWKIIKTTPEEMKTMGAPLTPWPKIGDNYYQRIYPQSGCEDKASEISAIDKAYSDLFDSLKSN